MKTGVCYYPEHWPRERWQLDAALMQQLGLSVIRVGEFAWSRLESANGELHLDWLEEAIEILHAHELSVVLGTPTATPPRWMLDKHPDMLAVDAQGRVRDFGSRRHYCFSHEGYLNECKRIVKVLAERFGHHPAVIAWQTDNEYGCHDTSISYSSHALTAFRQWCQTHYETIDLLNERWGNVFWSMEYDSFEQIGLPVGTVTESNPAHQLAYWRFSSDQIKRFNKAQANILRQHSPGRDILHNFMGNYFDFDHHSVCEDLDVATWDNYPLGFLTRDTDIASEDLPYLRTGHPDGSAFHHDLYRGCCNGRWWVMEQQPGPVNWAPYNPSPLPGMVRLWGWEAFAHGAEVMSYFRWRQAPFAQEQTHTGLLLPDAQTDVAATEIEQLNQELLQLPESADRQVQSPVAIVFSYPGIAMQFIQQMGGRGFNAMSFCQQLHSACRQWGVNVDIVAPTADLSRYKLVLLSSCTEDNSTLAGKLLTLKQNQQSTIALFPGTGSRTANYSFPASLAPGSFRELIDLTVVRSETLPSNMTLEARDNNSAVCNTHQWREHVQTNLTPRMQYTDGWGFHYDSDNVHYINAIPQRADLVNLVGQLIQESGLNGKNLGPDLRIQQSGAFRLAFNYGPESIDLDQHLGTNFQLSPDTELLVGNRVLAQSEVAVWVVE